MYVHRIHVLLPFLFIWFMEISLNMFKNQDLTFKHVRHVKSQVLIDLHRKLMILFVTYKCDSLNSVHQPKWLTY